MPLLHNDRSAIASAYLRFKLIDGAFILLIHQDSTDLSRGHSGYLEMDGVW